MPRRRRAGHVEVDGEKGRLSQDTAGGAEGDDVDVCGEDLGGVDWGSAELMGDLSNESRIQVGNDDLCFLLASAALYVMASARSIALATAASKSG